MNIAIVRNDVCDKSLFDKENYLKDCRFTNILAYGFAWLFRPDWRERRFASAVDQRVWRILVCWRK